jgi:hypothetical protein
MASEVIVERVRLLEDQRAVLLRLNAACFAIDGAEKDSWLKCFTEDGVFTWAPSADGATLLHCRGHESLAEWFSAHRASIPAGSQVHVLLHPLVEISGDAARVISTYVTIRSIGEEIGIKSAGRYHDRLARCSDGEWRLVERRAIGQMSRPTLARAGDSEESKQ